MIFIGNLRDDHFLSREMASPEGWTHFLSREMASPEGWAHFLSREMASPEGWAISSVGIGGYWFV